MSDETYEQAQEQAFRRQAEGLGAAYDIDATARGALSDQLGFLRNNPAYVETPDLPEGELSLMYGWGCDDEAAIILGRLQRHGWRLERAAGDAPLDVERLATKVPPALTPAATDFWLSIPRMLKKVEAEARAAVLLDVERLAKALKATGALWSANDYYETTTDADEFAQAIAAEYARLASGAADTEGAAE